MVVWEVGADRQVTWRGWGEVDVGTVRGMGEHLEWKGKGG